MVYHYLFVVFDETHSGMMVGSLTFGSVDLAMFLFFLGTSRINQYAYHSLKRNCFDFWREIVEQMSVTGCVVTF